MGLRRNDISDEEASCTAALWGPDPVHPTTAAYRMIAGTIEADLQDPDARYTNPPKQLQSGSKKARHDPSRERAGWVDGCSAALPRRDSAPGSVQRGRGANSAHTATGPPSRGYYRGRGSARGFNRGSHRAGRGRPSAVTGAATRPLCPKFIEIVVPLFVCNPIHLES
jgi:hypothetical protein